MEEQEDCCFWTEAFVVVVVPLRRHDRSLVGLLGFVGSLARVPA